MPILSQLLASVVTGYNELSDQEKFFFESSLSNIDAFSEIVENLEQKKGNMLLRTQFRQALESHDIYNEMIAAITQAVLDISIDDYSQLTPEEHDIISRHPASQQLVKTLLRLNKDEHLDRIDQQQWLPIISKLVLNRQDLKVQERIRKERLDAIESWQTTMLASTDIHFFSEIVLQKELVARERVLKLHQQHVKGLVNYFPPLAYHFPRDDLSHADKLLINLNLHLNRSKVELDRAAVKDFFNDLFNTLIEDSDSSLDLKEAFEKIAAEFSSNIVAGFNQSSPLQMANMLHRLNVIFDHIQAKLLNDKAQQWQTQEHTNLIHALSFVWNNPLINNTRAFMDKIADAHAFIHAVGYALHKENGFFSALDIYNYTRYKDAIVEVRSVMLNLLEPLFPLYLEYKFIAFYEKSGFWRSFRMIMPVFIIILFPTLLSLAVAPLLLPEIALTLLFIPSLCLGVAVANYYVLQKTEIYNKARTWFYGGSLKFQSIKSINA